MISPATTRCTANSSDTTVRQEPPWPCISCRIRRRDDGVDKKSEGFQLSFLDRGEQREAQASGRKRASLGRRRNDGDRGGRAKSEARLSRRSNRGIFLPAQGQHRSPHHGDSGETAARNPGQGRRNISSAQAPAPFAAEARGNDRGSD